MVSGYKQTDIGLIPLDWEVKKLGAVTDVIGGGTPSTSIKEYWNGNINWFTPTEISEIKYSYSSKRKITSLGLNNSSARMLPIGTILLTSRAGIGDLSILGTESSTNQGFQSLVTKKEINNEFLYYLMKTKKNVLLEYASGSTFLEISPKNLKSIQIPLPPLPEQEAIAEVLSDTDALIGALEKLIAKKRLIKQGTMQTLLTPKDDWEVKKLGEIILEIADGGTPSTTNQKYFGGKINWVVIDDIKDKIYSTKKTLTNLGLKNSSSRLWKPETIILSTGATIGEVGIAKVYTATKQGICGIVVKENVSNIFLKYWFIKYKNLLKSLAQGSSIKELRPPTLIQFNISIPSFPKQTHIATILSDMDNEIDALEKKLSKTKELKQGLMQQLLTGKIRLV